MNELQQFWFGRWPSLRAIRRARSDIKDFKQAYEEYLVKSLPLVDVGQAPTRNPKRERVMRLAVKAEAACDLAGKRVGLSTPAAFPGPPLLGLANVAFAHEDGQWQNPSVKPLFHSPPKSSYELALDCLIACDAALEVREEAAVRDLKNPLSWIDRALRSLLGIPGYLACLIFGLNPRQLSKGKQRVAQFLSAAGALASIASLWLTTR